MKSPEQVGGSPEQPYDKAKWEKLQKGAPAFAVMEGKKLGVPREELNRFAEDIIGRAIENQEYGFVYRFMINLGIGTEETARNVGKQAYDLFMTHKEYGLATAIAEDVYGKDSEEWKRAHQASETIWKKTEERIKKKEEKMESGEADSFVTLFGDATFYDLFKAIDNHEESESLDNYFTQELWDNFNSEIAEEVLAFRDTQASKAVTTKVLDFFKERGYSQSDILAFLPIKFKSERKKK